ncbi:MAG: FAD-dependent oxidoreductase, partial [Lachnospiraceae bacterium]|nr:FAD-dependent oxidoreductase [Lachnospiraceae bacterium]
TFSPNVENIPGFTSLSGNEFAEKLTEQAIFQGCEFEFGTVCRVETAGEKQFLVHTEEGGSFEGRSVILASGAKHRVLGLPKEDEFIGNGISFCAVCDGAFYEGQTVGVVGGGNSALVEAVLLADLVKHLFIFQDLDFLTGDAKLQKSLLSHDNVEVLTGVRVTKYLGEDSFAGVEVTDAKTGEKKTYDLDGLFVAIGLVPQNEAFQDLVELDERGYAIAGETMVTKTPGVFVAGDCRTKRIRQVSTAANDGAVAALQAVDYLEGRG